MTLFGQTLDGQQLFGVISLLAVLLLWIAVWRGERRSVRWFREWEAQRRARRQAEERRNGTTGESPRGPWG